jgi:hypothetical protein
MSTVSKKRFKNWPFQGNSHCFQGMTSQKRGDEDDSDTQKHGPAPSPDTVGPNKKTSTPSTSDRSTKTKAANLYLTQGKTVDALRTATSYFDVVWNAFAQQKDCSLQWIPEQIVGIGEDFHSQVDDDKVKTTLYKVRWNGYDRTGDTWDHTSTG